jgi:hypothetical protein
MPGSWLICSARGCSPRCTRSRRKTRAARDLSRARDDLREDLTCARHRLSKFLLRRAITFSGKKAWTNAHRRWLESLRFDNPADSAVVADYLLAIEHVEQRLKSLLVHVERLGHDPRYAKAKGLGRPTSTA